MRAETPTNHVEQQKKLVAWQQKQITTRTEDAPLHWDTSPGRKWVVVAFWGSETTVTFHRDREEASDAYCDAVDKGADAFYAETKRMMMQSDKSL